MRKSELDQDQLTIRGLFVDTLARAGWRGLNFNQKFDQGLWTSPEASMEYKRSEMTLRCDFLCGDPRLILYMDSRQGKSIGLVFRYRDRLLPLLATLVRVQGAIDLNNLGDVAEELLVACPEMFKIASSSDGLIPVRSRAKR